MKPIYHQEELVEGLATQFLVQSFSDRVLVLVTQLGKVGCLIQATLPQTIQLPHFPKSSIDDRMIPPAPPPSVELTPLLGHPPTPELHTFYNLLAAQLSTIVWCSEGGEDVGFGSRRPIVVGIALKQNQDLETLYKSLVDALVRLLGNN